MITARSIHAVRKATDTWRRKRLTIGLVPTMGALHEGHLALIQRSKRLSDRTVVSIFVNPTQFGQNEDFGKYPRSWRSDRLACERAGVDLIFAPTVGSIYPDGFVTSVHVGRLGEIWEGQSRPGHFDGVATMVAKLLNIVQPDLAVFGRKDYQQSLVIRRLTANLNLPVKVIVAPTVRERGGLALSSRNAYLDDLSRTDAQSIYRSLLWAKDQVRAGERNVARLIKEMTNRVESGQRFKLDYIGFCHPESLVPMRTVRPPVVILVAAYSITKGAAYRRRYIDNLLIR